MNSINLVSKFGESSIPIQVITLRDSFFVYVGTAEMNFENLIVSMNYNDVYLVI
jgi:hypothetical protein